MSTKFTWGDTVQITNAHYIREPGKVIGEVCGFLVLSDSKLAEQFKQPIGTVIYTVEFGDGSSEEFPEMAIALYEG